ncbi:pirin family protein [Flavobacterium pallidum]|uniref:Pirin n=1 Tax=Flavobacterium pallidum TaxID=2172098 RepID=A0A2S1SFC8_9FLAO|nr:pirin family protein [Flavobacterium pallidum]AWI25116.1 pirin [Flavobacterium pallidum]
MFTLFRNINKTTPKNPAKIHKSEMRGKMETDIFKCLSVFNFGNNYDESRKPFGALKVFNEETLSAGESVTMTIRENTDILLLPLLGSIDYMDTLGNQGIINTEEIRIFSAQKNMAFDLVNPYEGEPINYLQIWISNKREDFAPFSFQHKFDFSTRNQLMPLYESSFASCRMGIYGRRNEGNYTMADKQNGLFAFVISGTFEFDGRILEHRDSVSTWKINRVSFRALSENAVILLIEVPSF